MFYLFINLGLGRRPYARHHKHVTIFNQCLSHYKCQCNIGRRLYYIDVSVDPIRKVSPFEGVVSFQYELYAIRSKER